MLTYFTTVEPHGENGISMVQQAAIVEEYGAAIRLVNTPELDKELTIRTPNWFIRLLYKFRVLWLTKKWPTKPTLLIHWDYSVYDFDVKPSDLNR